MVSLKMAEQPPQPRLGGSSLASCVTVSTLLMVSMSNISRDAFGTTLTDFQSTFVLSKAKNPNRICTKRRFLRLMPNFDPESNQEPDAQFLALFHFSSSFFICTNYKPLAAQIRTKKAIYTKLP